MRKKRVLQAAFGLENAVVEGVDVDEVAVALIVSVRPTAKARHWCGRCGRRSPGYDRGAGRRRWRALDLGTCRVFLEGDASRVACRDHGPTVAAVPWARHGAGHTRDFDDQAAWLAVHVSKSAVGALLRVAWRTVGAIVARVGADIDAKVDRLDGLVRIGIDEISYKRGYRYLTVVVDHDSGRLVWAAPGRDTATLNGFFDALGTERAARITHVTADMAGWIATVVAERATNATLCIDAFHVIAWATDALDEVRRQVWNEARRGGMSGLADQLKGCRYALWRNPEDLTPRQAGKLAWIAKVNTKLYRAYLMKEQLRLAIRTKGVLALAMLDDWLAWVQRCRIPAFVELGRKIRKNIAGIEAAMLNDLSNALIESTNTKIRVLHRMAFGFAKPEHLIALALLDRGGYCPPLPGR